MTALPLAFDGADWLRLAGQAPDTPRGETSHSLRGFNSTALLRQVL